MRTAIKKGERLLGNDRLSLRALEPEDLQILFDLENDTRLWRCGITRAPYSRYVLKRYIEESYKDIYEAKQLRLMIVLPNNEVAGIADLSDFDPFNMRAEVGILIAPAYQNQGIATEAIELLKQYAFDFLNMKQLYAYVAVNNVHSVSLFKKCGFVVSGTLKDWVVSDEGYTDTLFMQCLADEDSSTGN
jgi:diamine N-acetyltransferase